MNYKWGFNGKENDREVLSGGRFQDYGFRAYRPDLGRFFAVDPLKGDYPELTTYQFASNTPIQAIDLDGLEAWMTRDGKPSSVNGPLNKEYADKNGLVPFASSKPPESPKVPNSKDVERNANVKPAERSNGMIEVEGDESGGSSAPRGNILKTIKREIIDLIESITGKNSGMGPSPTQRNKEPERATTDPFDKATERNQTMNKPEEKIKEKQRTDTLKHVSTKSAEGIDSTEYDIRDNKTGEITTKKAPGSSDPYNRE